MSPRPLALLGEARRQAAFVLHMRRVQRRRAVLPPVADGDVVAPPDFVGVGAQRCGTSWLDALVHRHPDVVRSPLRQKELHHFTRFHSRPFTDADAAAYARFFPRPPGTLAGEFSPRYWQEVWTPPLLRRAAPDVKLLVLLRDPVLRYASGLTRHAVEGGPLRAATVQAAFEAGCYAGHLERLYRHFPREQVLVLQLEQCLAAPREALARTYAFLGLADFAPSLEHGSARRFPRQELPADRVDVLREAYAGELDRLAALAPELDLSLWTTVRPRRR